ncbi:MAG: extracellular solute-binding protein [Chloroflexi bacterium]|nr:extracellular solute-binding protein [Chloroflexota bacterium]
MSNRLTWFREHKRQTLALLVIGLLAILFVTWWRGSRTDDVLYIALVCSEIEGYTDDCDMMHQATQLYLDQVNEEVDQVNGKRVEMLPLLDDQGTRYGARERAREIVEQDQALVVLGHYFSSASIAASPVYKGARIPAIAGVSLADALTRDSDWYFRVVPDTDLEGVFLANYVRQVMGHETVSILYDSHDDYSFSLATSFAYPFLGLGGTVEHQWDLYAQADNVDTQIARIVDGLLQDDPDLIFIASQQNEAYKFIVSLRRKGLMVPIVGGASMGDSAFAARFNEYSEERTRPGFFSDNIYASTPLIFDIAGERAQQFKSDYEERYQQEPNWVAAGAYDAVMLAVKAMRATGVQGDPRDRSAERTQIRDYLALLTSAEDAMPGVGGNIYLDELGDPVKSVVMGQFEKQHFISAPTQFVPVSDLAHISDLSTALAENQVLVVNGKYMYQTNVVYVGIDFNEISELDMKESTYKLDFYLWFRCQGDVHANDIQFINTVKDIDLGSPVAERTLGDVVYQAYRVVGTFKGDFDFRNYPFDQQRLEVRFQHADAMHDNLIYVVDQVGMQDTTSAALKIRLDQARALESLADWRVNRVGIFQDVFTTDSTLGNPRLFDADTATEYSRFNAFVEIERNATQFILKSMVNLFIVFFLAYLSLYLPLGHGARLSFATSALFTTALFHLSLTTSLPQIGYAVAMEYFFYAGYVLSVVLVFFQLIDLRLDTIQKDMDEEEQKNIEDKRLSFNRIGRIVYPLVLLFVVIAFTFRAGVIASTLESVQETLHIVSNLDIRALFSPDDNDTEMDEEIVLTLGSQHVDNKEQINRFLARFNTKYPHITVRFDPSRAYDVILQTQLENGMAPDLLYLSSFSASRPLFEMGHLESLQDLSGLNDSNFTQEARVPWTSDDGEPYAVPLMAVSHGIYYNVDIFEQLDLTIPTTWEELLATSRAIQDAGYVPFANSTGHEMNVDDIFMSLAPNFIGGREGREAYLSGERCFDDEHTVAAFQAVADLAPFLYSPQEKLISPDNRRMFLQAESPMLMGDSSDVAFFQARTPNFEWSVFAVPALAGQPEYITFHPDFAIGLNAASLHKEEAKLFLEWLTSAETAQAFTDELAGFFPIHRNAPALINEHANVFLSLNQMRGQDVRWASPMLRGGVPSGYRLMQDATVAVALGEMTPQEAAIMLQSGLRRWFEPAQRCDLTDQDAQSPLFIQETD